MNNIVSPALIVSLELSSKIVSATRLYSAILSTLVFASMFRCDTPFPLDAAIFLRGIPVTFCTKVFVPSELYFHTYISTFASDAL